MTPNHLSKIINSLNHRKRMSLTIDSLETEIISFLIAKGFENKPVAVNGWELLFDGQKLTLCRVETKGYEQLELWKGG